MAATVRLLHVTRADHAGIETGSAAWAAERVIVEVTALSALAADPNADLATVKEGPAGHAVLAQVLLLVATVLSVFKPRGVTRYGWRKQHQRRSPPSRPLPAPAATGTRGRTDERAAEG